MSKGLLRPCVVGSFLFFVCPAPLCREGPSVRPRLLTVHLCFACSVFSQCAKNPSLHQLQHKKGDRKWSQAADRGESTTAERQGPEWRIHSPPTAEVASASSDNSVVPATNERRRKWGGEGTRVWTTLQGGWKIWCPDSATEVHIRQDRRPFIATLFSCTGGICIVYMYNSVQKQCTRTYL